MMNLRENGLIKTVLIFTIPLFILGCSVNRVDNLKPTWLDDPKSIVGVCGFIPSENLSIQKRIALQRAVIELSIQEGIVHGVSDVNTEKLYIRQNDNESLHKKMKENSIVNVQYKEIEYRVKIVAVWKDEETKEVYVKVEKL